jgi:hypothetical protein
MNERELRAAIKGFTARRAVGASAVRGSQTGTRQACQVFLGSVHLSQFARTDAAIFRSTLDRATEKMSAMRSHAPSWGLARKLLNIFPRDSLYTVQLREAYGLADAASLFEVPLDSITAACLANEVLKMQVSCAVSEAATRSPLLPPHADRVSRLRVHRCGDSETLE